MLHKKESSSPTDIRIFFSTIIHTTLQNFLVPIFDHLTHNQSIVKKFVLSALLQTLQLEEPIHIAIIDNLQ